MGKFVRLNKPSWELCEKKEQLHPSHTALLVIDMQNDFVSAKGKMADFGFENSMVQAIVPTLKGFLAEARKLGVFVVHARVINDAAQNAPSWYAYWGEPVVTLEGSWGAEFYPGLEPIEGEPVVTKYAYGSFEGTNLDIILRRRDIRTLVVTGAGSLICSGDTIHKGFALGYHIVVPEDCMADFSTEGPEWSRTINEVGMYIIAHHYGKVMNSADILKSWRCWT